MTRIFGGPGQVPFVAEITKSVPLDATKLKWGMGQNEQYFINCQKSTETVSFDTLTGPGVKFWVGKRIAMDYNVLSHRIKYMADLCVTVLCLV